MGMHLNPKEYVMRKILFAAVAALALGGFTAGAHAWTLPNIGTGLVGASSSGGGGHSESGGATTTSSGTTFGGAGSTFNSFKTYETSGPSLSDGFGMKMGTTGSLFGSSYQTSSTNGPAGAGSHSSSGVTVCAGPACTAQ
jgi:hypothetical protein